MQRSAGRRKLGYVFDEDKLVAHLDDRMGSHSGHFPELQWACPFCLDRRGSESAERKLRMNVRKGEGICFRCGYAVKDLKRLLLDLNGGKLTDAELSLLSGEVYGDYVDRVNDVVLETLFAAGDGTGGPVDVRKLRPVRLPAEYVPLYKKLRGIDRVLCARGLAYAKKRSITEAELKAFQIGYCPDGVFGQRLIFPVTMFGKVVYHTNRSVIPDVRMKSRNPDNVEGYFSKTTCLLNYDACVGAPVVGITEGPISCVMQSRVVPSVALMGKRIDPTQLGLLDLLVKTGTKEFVIALDADAVDESTRLYAAMCGRGVRVTWQRLGWGDPDDRRDELAQFVEERRAPGLLDVVQAKIGGDRAWRRFSVLRGKSH